MRSHWHRDAIHAMCDCRNLSGDPLDPDVDPSAAAPTASGTDAACIASKWD
jgi:hypothetical protein